MTSAWEKKLLAREEKLLEELAAAIRALRIYDDCMNDLSFFVGHMAGRCTNNAHDVARAACARAMKAQRVLRRLDPPSKGKK